jgi:cytochrome P450
MTAVFTPRGDMSLDEIDLSSLDFWLAPRDDREEAFATLRRHAPVRFFPEIEVPGFPVPGPGYFAVTRFDDVWHASRSPQLFCSGRGVSIPDLPIEIAEFFGSMINMDDPRHARLRGIVQAGFTPRMVARVEGYVRDKARALVDGVLEQFPGGECDFVQEIAAPLPLQIICEMMGIPADDEKKVFGWTNVILGAGDPDYGESLDVLMAAALEMFQYAQDLGQDRLDHPADDLTSTLMHAVVDGERLTTQEFGSFFILLVVAGNETTRNAISHGMKALTDHPEQRDAWWNDFDDVTRTAVEEIVRWASPVIHFRRTALADTEIAGVTIKEGEKVVLWYNSANRDDTKFADPFRFDVRRDPNPQVGFGAGGPHFCLGANLARREISVMFDEIRRRLPDLQITGEPAYLQSSFINGIKRMPCAFTNR